MRAMIMVTLLSLLGIMLAVPTQTAAVYCGPDTKNIHLKLNSRTVNDQEEAFTPAEWNGLLIVRGTSQIRLWVEDSKSEVRVVLDFNRERVESND